MNTKVCGTCKALFPLSLEHFSKDSSKRDGLKTVCKSCERARNHERYYSKERERKIIIYLELMQKALQV